MNEPKLFASSTPEMWREFQKVDTSKEPFEYSYLELHFKFYPSDIDESRELWISCNVPGIYAYNIHAHPQLCVQHEYGHWVWDLGLVDAYILIWVLRNKATLNLQYTDIAEIIRLWVGKA